MPVTEYRQARIEKLVEEAQESRTSQDVETVFKFNPCQDRSAHFIRALFGWYSTYKGEL